MEEKRRSRTMWWTIIAVVALFLILKFFLGHDISVDGAAGKLAEGAVLIDVRTPGEFASGAAPGAVNIPLDEIQARISEVVPDKDKPIVLYCHSGARAAVAAKTLRRAGYANVSNVGTLSRASQAMEKAGRGR
jgi:phage shock protein E